MLAASDERHIPHSLFVIADNKQTIPRIVKPLRQLGISVAGIVDVDVLKEGGADWTNQLTAIGVPALELSSYGNRRKQISDLLTQAADSQKSEHTKKRDFKTCGGLRLLSNDELEAAENLLNDLKTYGLFIVPHGEVENWLEYADAPRSKHNWLKKIFELMGHDPHDSNYIRPQEGDVWDFLGKVSSWIKNPNRRGIPN
ncbi:hypothetical protein [Ochrobactrum sp. SFR4]|uniref:hypothetical protein n=1 Tax=Ochrobactrum sp. SFR4 TaxID=2717368 RepID=UPI001C8B71E8|nr:hypothetical protein [Ochrobactrum sp. SFR4]MBX8824470.1 hypothetical protein [Ochrobactrum sp. SFR4]